MEPTMKSISDFTPMARPLAVAGASQASQPAIPVQQAFAALGEPDTTVELGAASLRDSRDALVRGVGRRHVPAPGRLRRAAGRSRRARRRCAAQRRRLAVRQRVERPGRSGDADARAGRRDLRSRRKHVGAGDFRGRARELHRRAAPARRAQLLDAGSRRADPALARRSAISCRACVRAAVDRSTAWLQRDLASARDMQRMFLPRPLETNSAHVRVLAEYLPAFAVGGDFYDFVDLGGGRLLATIGDVSGKGVTAALMMSRVTSELRRLAHECSGPAEILTRLNRSLRGMQDDRFVTVVCVLLDVPNRRWVVGERRPRGAAAAPAHGRDLGPGVFVEPTDRHDPDAGVPRRDLPARVAGHRPARDRRRARDAVGRSARRLLDDGAVPAGRHAPQGAARSGRDPPPHPERWRSRRPSAATTSRCSGSS